MKDAIQSESNSKKSSVGESLFGITLKQFIISIVVTLGFCYIAAYTTLMPIIPAPRPFLEIGERVPVAGVMGLVVLLLMISGFFNKKLKISFLTQRDIYVIFVFVGTAGMSIVSALQFYVVGWLGLGKKMVMSPDYYETFFQTLSPLVFPQNVDMYYDALLGGVSIPWGEWIAPIITWTAFWTLVVFLFVCMAVMVRRRWEDVEQLSYPLITPMLHYFGQEENDKGILGNIWSSSTMWWGFGLAALFVLMEFLGQIIPGFTFVDRRHWIRSVLGGIVKSSPIISTMFGDIVSQLQIDPSVIGVLYFVLSLDALFSIWFFGLVYFPLFNYILILLGRMEPGTAVEAVAMGGVQAAAGFVALGISLLWVMRKDIIGFFEKTASEEDRLPRLAVICLGVGAIVLVLFGRYMLGIDILWGLVFLLMMFLTFLSSTRARVEAGYFATGGPAMPMDRWFLSGVVGTSNIPAATWVGLGQVTMVASSWGGIGGMMGHVLESWKLGSRLGVSRESVTKVVIIAFAVSFALGLVILMPFPFEHGLYQMHSSWNQYWPSVVWNTTDIAVTPGLHEGPNPLRIVAAVIGGGMTLLLSAMRMMFVWWPFHPLGFIMGVHRLRWWWLGNAFIVWFVKFLVFRYGGNALAKKISPFFIGLVGGEFVLKIVLALTVVVLRLFGISVG